jgi:hypothetical protein
VPAAHLPSNEWEEEELNRLHGELPMLGEEELDPDRPLSPAPPAADHDYMHFLSGLKGKENVDGHSQGRGRRSTCSHVKTSPLIE